MYLWIYMQISVATRYPLSPLPPSPQIFFIGKLLIPSNNSDTRKEEIMKYLSRGIHIISTIKVLYTSPHPDTIHTHPGLWHIIQIIPSRRMSHWRLSVNGLDIRRLWPTLFGLIPCSSIKSISNICSLQQRLYPSSFCSIKLGSSVFLHLPSNSNILIFFCFENVEIQFCLVHVFFFRSNISWIWRSRFVWDCGGRVIKANAKIAETLISNTE